MLRFSSVCLTNFSEVTASLAKSCKGAVISVSWSLKQTDYRVILTFLVVLPRTKVHTMEYKSLEWNSHCRI